MPIENFFTNYSARIFCAWVINEPKFTGLREICELWKNQPHRKYQYNL